MIGFIVRRFAVSALVVLGIALVSFIVIQLPPGDYADGYKSFLIENGGATEAEAEAQAELFRQRYGLDKPLPLQFYVWIRDMVTKGSFGFSFAYKRDVGELIAERLPRTLLLTSLRNEDIYIAASCLLIYGVLLVAGNLIADISLAVLDPRVRFS